MKTAFMQFSKPVLPGSTVRIRAKGKYWPKIISVNDTFGNLYTEDKEKRQFSSRCVYGPMMILVTYSGKKSVTFKAEEWTPKVPRSKK